MMRNRLKQLDGKSMLTVLLVIASLVTVAAGFIAQSLQYNELFGLYERQNSQLKADGIKPITPSPAQIANQGPVGDQGLTGDPGPQGVAGVPVFSWTFATATGVQMRCIRSVPFDTQAPTYNCAAVTPTPATTH
jgi:hypothetical protein